VSTVAPGSTVLVCPGTYAEQVTITKALTLQGVTAGTADQVLVTVPSTGLVQNTTSIFTEPVAAQILVEGAGQVHISDISVDGKGGDLLCASWSAGIFYGSGSSGTVSRVRASGQINGACGVGIWAENGNNGGQWVAILDSSVYNVDSAGIFAGSGANGANPSLFVDVRRNVVNAGAAVAEIDADSVIGEVRANDLSNGAFGVFDISPAVSVNVNAILGATIAGIYLGNGGIAENNHISGANIGVLLGANGATVNENRIVSSVAAAMELGCFTANVNENFINDALVGLDASPSNSVRSNTFANTATTITGGCAIAAFAPLAPRANLLLAPVTNSRQQWHTPATPFGTRTK
jgi:hypothetical protein